MTNSKSNAIGHAYKIPKHPMSIWLIEKTVKIGLRYIKYRFSPIKIYIIG